MKVIDVIRITAKHVNPKTNEESISLDDVSFEVQEGERIGLIGPSIASQSDLIKILGRTMSPVSGSLSVTKQAEVIDFKDPVDGKMDIYKYIKTKYKTKVNEATLDDALQKLAVDDYKERTFNQLSRFQQLRMRFAAAYAMGTRILLVNNFPTTGGKGYYESFFKELKLIGFTIVVSFMFLPQAFSFMDKILMIRQGKVVLYDTPENFKNSKDISILKFLYENWIEI